MPTNNSDHKKVPRRARQVPRLVEPTWAGGAREAVTWTALWATAKMRKQEGALQKGIIVGGEGLTCTAFH